MTALVLMSLAWAVTVALAVLGLGILQDDRLRQMLEKEFLPRRNRGRKLSWYFTAGALTAAWLRLKEDPALENRLRRAGLSLQISSRDFKGTKAAGFLLGCLLTVVGEFLYPPLLFLGAMLTLGLYMGPEWWLDRVAKARQERIDVEVAEAVDVISVAVESGAGIERSIHLYTVYFDGPLAEEFRLFRSDLANGMPRREAYAAMRSRSQSEELHKLVRTLNQAEELGVPVARAIRALAHDSRVDRAQNAKERAAKASPKITLITTFLLAPTTALFIIGALVLNVIYNPTFGFQQFFSSGGF